MVVIVEYLCSLIINLLGYLNIDSSVILHLSHTAIASIMCSCLSI